MPHKRGSQWSFRAPSSRSEASQRQSTERIRSRFTCERSQVRIAAPILRVPGATIPVKEPGRLADLFARGEQAHARARKAAENARSSGFLLIAQSIRNEAAVVEEDPDRPFIMGFGLASTVVDARVGTQLFGEPMRDLLVKIGHELGSSSYPIKPHIWTQVGQDQRVVIVSPEARHEPQWTLTAFWDGSVGVACRAANSGGRADGIVDDFVARAHLYAKEVAAALGAGGPAYLDIVVGDASHPPLANTIAIRRGPLEPGAAPDWAFVQRELQRAMGVDVLEPRAQSH